MSVKWEDIEKMFFGDIRRTILMYVWLKEPVHVYKIGKDLELLGMTASKQSVIEIVRNLRKSGVFKERNETTKERRKRTVLEVNWDLIFDALLRHVEKYVKLTDQEKQKFREAFMKSIHEYREGVTLAVSSSASPISSDVKAEKVKKIPELEKNRFREAAKEFSKIPLLPFFIGLAINALESDELKDKLQEFLLKYLFETPNILTEMVRTYAIISEFQP